MHEINCDIETAIAITVHRKWQMWKCDYVVALKERFEKECTRIDNEKVQVCMKCKNLHKKECEMKKDV